MPLFHLSWQDTCSKIRAKYSSVTHANLLWFEHTGQGKKEAPVQKSSAMTDIYVCRGVETDKNVPLTVVALQSLESWSRSTSAPTYATALYRLGRTKVRFCKKYLPCPIVLI